MEYIKGYKLFKESLDTEAINEAFSSSILRDLSSQSRGKWGGNLAKDMQKYARKFSAPTSVLQTQRIVY